MLSRHHNHHHHNHNFLVSHHLKIIPLSNYSAAGAGSFIVAVLIYALIIASQNIMK
jgi:hypothetical protein